MSKTVSKNHIRKTRKRSHYVFFDAYQGIIGMEKVPPNGETADRFQWPNMAAVVVPNGKKGRRAIKQIQTTLRNSPQAAFLFLELASISGNLERRIPAAFEEHYEAMVEHLLSAEEIKTLVEDGQTPFSVS